MEPNAYPARVIRARTVDPDRFATDIAEQVSLAALDAVALMPAIPGLCRRSAPRIAWQYLRDRVAYIPELGDQYVRMPWRTMSDGRADCKSQAVFVAGLCGPVGCAVDMRFVMLPDAVHLGHVYAVVDGIPVDPLLPYGHEVVAAAVVDVPVSDGKAR